MFLKQSTAQTVVIGPVLDADGVAVTTAVVTNFSLAKNGTASAFTTETLTSLGNGYYSLALTTSNTNTLGIAAVFTNASTMSMTVFRWNVIAASVYDAIVNTATNASGGLVTATGAISAMAGAISTLTSAQVRTELATELGRIDATVSSRATQTSVDTVAGYIDTEVAAIKAKTDLIPSNIGSVIVAANVNQRTVSVTGSQHIAADIHEFQPGVISEGDFADAAISARVIATDAIGSDELAASAVTEIQSGLATSSGVTSAFTEIKGAGWSSSTDTLEKISDSAGSGGATVIVSPLSAQAPERVVGTTIDIAVGDRSPVSVDVFDANDVAVDLSAQGNLEVCIESRNNVDLQVVAHASITIGGTGNRRATWTPNAAAVATVDKHRWSLRTESAKKVLAYGPWVVSRVALKDA